MERISFINSYVDRISIDNVIEDIFYSINSKTKKHIVFLNALKIYEIWKNKSIAKAMHEAEFILADGVPIVWASRLLGKSLPGRVNGTDLFERLLENAALTGKKVFLLGAKQNVLENLVVILKNKYVGLQIAGYRNGYFNEKDDQDVISEINNSNADILFLGFSSPKKEIWANKYKNILNTPIIQGVGGSFDVLAGLIPRAPVWMQNNGLEWLYRVIKEPRRMFKRYLISNSVFIFLFLKSFFKQRILGISNPL